MASDTQPARPKRSRSGWKLAGLIILALLVLTAAALFWLLGTSSGARTALSAVASLTGGSIQAEGISGRLSDRIQVDMLVIDNPGKTVTLSNVDMLWHPSELLQRRLHVEKLQAQHLTVLQKEQEDEQEPAQLPASISAPLQLQIDSVAIESGEIRNSDVTLAELDKVAFDLQFDGQRYVFNLNSLDLQSSQDANEVEGSLKGKLTLSATQPYPIEARFASDAQGQLAQQSVGAQGDLILDGTLADLTARADLNINRTQVKGHVQLRPFSKSILGDADLAIRALNLAGISPDLPITQLNLKLQAQANGEGKLSATNAEAGLLNRNRIPLTSLSLAFDHNAQATRFRNLRAELGNGVQAAGTVTGSGQFEEGKLSVDLRTERLNLRHIDERMRPTQLSGSVAMQHAGSRQVITLDLSEPLNRNRMTLTARAAVTDEALTVPQAVLRIGKGVATLSGSMQRDGKQAFEAGGKLQRFRIADIGEFAELPDLLLNGNFAVEGHLAPQLQGALSFDLKDSRIAGNPLQGSGQARLKGESITIPGLTLIAGANRLQVEGALSEQRSRLAFVIDAPQLHQLSPQFGGALQVKGNAVGTLESPRLDIEWSASQLQLPEDIRIGSAQGKADVHLDRDQPFSLRALTADLQAGALSMGEQTVSKVAAQLQFSPRAGAPLQLDVTANEVDLGVVQADALSLTGDGTTARHTLRAAGTDRDQRWEAAAEGGLSRLDKAPRWQGEISQLMLQGQISARLRDPAPLLVSAQQTEVEDFVIDTDTGLIAVERFERDASGLSTRGRIERLQLGELLSLAMEEPPVRTDLELSGAWNVDMDKTLKGNFSFRRERGDVVVLGQTPIPLGLRTLELDANTAGGDLQLHLLAEGAQLGQIMVDAAVDGRRGSVQFSPNSRLSGSVQLDVPDISWAGPIISSTLIADGRLNSRIALGGTLAEPQLDGQLQGHSLRLFFADTGVDLRQGTLISRFDDSRLVIESLRFAQGDGYVSLSGPIEFAEGQPDVQLALQARQYRILNRADRRLTLSGDSRITLRKGEAAVTGRLTVDSGFFDIGQAGMPDLSNDVIIVGQKEEQAASFPLALDLVIGLGDGITLTGQGLDAIVVGEVRLLSGAGDAIQAQGTLRIAEGTFTAYGRELAIERGVLQFSGPVDNPGLNILAMRREQEVAAGVSIGGTVLAPRISLVSEPPLPDAEKLSWLVFGRGLEAVEQGDTAVLQAAAGALLGGRESAGMQSQIAGALGLDTLSLSTADDGLRERIVTVGKQLSSRLYVSYRQGLENLTSVLLLRYELTRRLTLEAEAGSRSALSIFYNIAFD